MLNELIKVNRFDYEEYRKNLHEHKYYTDEWFEPTPQDFKDHSIQYCLSEANEYVKIVPKECIKQASFILYDVWLSIFKLKLYLMNCNTRGANCCQRIAFGSFADIIIRAIQGKQIVVKRQYFNSSINSPFGMKANKEELEFVICEVAITKICSLFRIGPRVDNSVGFDLICFDDCVQFYLEYCENMKSKPNINLSKLENDLKQCLFVLHCFKIIHKDIKPSNILYSKTLLKYVLADFGLSHPVFQMFNQKSLTFYEGTYSFMSPEMKKIKIKKQGYVNLVQNDIFGLELSIDAIRKHIKDWEKQPTVQSSIDSQKFISVNPTASSSIIENQVQKESFKQVDKIELNRPKCEYEFYKVLFNVLVEQEDALSALQPLIKQFTLSQIILLTEINESIVVLQEKQKRVQNILKSNRYFTTTRRTEVNFTFPTYKSLMNYLRVYGYQQETLRQCRSLKQYIHLEKIIVERFNQNVGQSMETRLSKYKRKLRRDILVATKQASQMQKILKIYHEIIDIKIHNQLRNWQIKQIITEIEQLRVQDPLDIKYRNFILMEMNFLINELSPLKMLLVQTAQDFLLSKQSLQRLPFLNLLAVIYKIDGKFVELLDIQMQKLKIVESSIHKQDLPICYYQIANSYIFLFRFSQAEIYCDKLFACLDTEAEYFRCLYLKLKAEILFNQQQIEMARDYIERAFKMVIRQYRQQIPMVLHTILILSAIYIDNRKGEQAIKYLQLNLKILTQCFHAHHRELIPTYDMLASAYLQLGHYVEAQRYLNLCLNIHFRFDQIHSYSLGLTCLQFCRLYYCRKQYHKSLQFSQKAYEAYIGFTQHNKNLQNNQVLSMCYAQLSRSHRFLKHSVEAIKFANLAHLVLEADQWIIKEYYIKIMLLKAQAYVDFKDAKQTQQYLLQCIVKICEFKVRCSQAEIELYRILAQSLYFTQQYQLCIQHLQKLIKLWESSCLKETFSIWKVWELLGDCFRLTYKLSLCSEAYQNSLRLHQEFEHKVRQSGMSQSYSYQFHHFRAIICCKLSKYSQAIEYLEKILPLAISDQKTMQLYEQLLTCYMELQRYDLIIQFFHPIKQLSHVCTMHSVLAFSKLHFIFNDRAMYAEAIDVATIGFKITKTLITLYKDELELYKRRVAFSEAVSEAALFESIKLYVYKSKQLCKVDLNQHEQLLERLLKMKKYKVALQTLGHLSHSHLMFNLYFQLKKYYLAHAYMRDFLKIQQQVPSAKKLVRGYYLHMRQLVDSQIPKRSRRDRIQKYQILKSALFRQSNRILQHNFQLLTHQLKDQRMLEVRPGPYFPINQAEVYNSP